jgi:hypothetical protein
MNSFLKLATILTTSALAIAASAGIAKADMVKLRDANLCLNRNGNNTLSFTTCQNGNDNQNFRRTSEDIVHSSSGLCVARDQRQRTPQNFDRAVLQPCNISPSIISQNGQFILWKYQNFALDAFGNNPQNGANAQFYTKGNASQQLRFVGSVGQSQPQPPAPTVTQAQPSVPQTYKKTIYVRPPNGTQVACGPACGVAVGVVVTVVAERVVDLVTNDWTEIKWYNDNSEGASWEQAALACDKEDYHDYKGFKDYQLVWFKHWHHAEAHKTCIRHT